MSGVLYLLYSIWCLGLAENSSEQQTQQQWANKALELAAWSL